MGKAPSLRACLVSNRVGLAGAESAPFTRRTASRGPSLRGGFFGFRSVPSKEWTCFGSVDCWRLGNHSLRKGERCHEQTLPTHRSFAEKLSGWYELPSKI